MSKEEKSEGKLGAALNIAAAIVTSVTGAGSVDKIRDDHAKMSQRESKRDEQQVVVRESWSSRDGKKTQS